MHRIQNLGQSSNNISLPHRECASVQPRGESIRHPALHHLLLLQLGGDDLHKSYIVSIQRRRPACLYMWAADIMSTARQPEQ